MNGSKKYIGLIFTGVAIIVLFILFKLYNPYQDHLFPKCPFYSITGLKCPLCGSQRAIYNLFKLDFISAFKENMLLVISIPYIMFLIYMRNFRYKDQKYLIISKILYDTKSIYIISLIIVCFCIFRNIAF